MEVDMSNMSKRERKELKRALKNQAAGQDNGIVRSLLIWGSVIVVLILGLFWIVSSGDNKKVGVQPDTVVDMKVSDKDWITGNRDGKITMVEYSDLQCPACKSYQPLVRGALKNNPEIKLVYRHFPLRSIHKNAQLAAQAAEAAGIQGKFFEMHDKLFENQELWASDKDPMKKFEIYAKEIGIDVDKFKEDTESNQIRDLVEEDYRSGMDLRVNSTPTFYVNGKKISNPKSKEDFFKLIENASK